MKLGAAALAGGAAIALATGQATAGSGSSACTAAQATARLHAFAWAFNHGNSAALDGLFSRAPAFHWFSSNAPGSRTSPAANDRATLLPYLRRRHALADRLTVVSC